MEVNIQLISGNWDLGYSLDKHTLSSTFLGNDGSGHPRFDTTRSEAGEALYQLKYQSDYSQVQIISSQLHKSLSSHFLSSALVIPMPPSKTRSRQPVIEIAQALATEMGIPCRQDILTKTQNTPQMKDIESRVEKVKALTNTYSVNDVLVDGVHDILIIDDLYDSGSSLAAATAVLRPYKKIGKIFVAVVTRTRNA